MRALLGEISQEQIELLQKVLNNCVYKDGKWDHKAHLTLGFFFATKYREQAFEKIKHFILEGDRFAGIPPGKTYYHETLTIFWTNLLLNFIANNQIDKFNNESLTLLFSSDLMNKDLVFDYYSREFVSSDLAKKVFVRPDLIFHL